MKTISRPLAKAMASYNIYQFLQFTVQAILIGIFIQQLATVLSIQWNFLALAFYHLFIIYTKIQIYLTLKNLDSVIYMAYQTSEIVTKNNHCQTVKDMINIYQDQNESKWRVQYASLKMKFHIYCCESLYFFQFFLLAGLIQLYIALDVISIEQINFQIVAVVLLNIYDIIQLNLALIIEFPRRIRIFYRRWRNNRKRQRAQEQLLDLECSICLGPLTLENTVTLACHYTHKFHQHCINEWQTIQNVCPNCKLPIKFA